MGVLLVFSLQTGAAVMFAGSVEPGWHDALLPFAFVAAAIFAGVAFMAAAAVALRGIFRLQSLITDAHLRVLAVLLLVLGLVNLYCYAAEFFSTLLGNDSFETAVLVRRLTACMPGRSGSSRFWRFCPFMSSGARRRDARRCSSCWSDCRFRSASSAITSWSSS